MNFKQCWGFSLLIISLFVLWQIRQLLLLIFTAIILATALNRLVKWFEKFNITRSLALSITLSLSLLSVVLFIWLIIPPFIQQFQNLIELLPSVWNKVDREIDLFQQKLPEFLPPLPSRKDLIAQLPSLQELLANFFSFFSNSLTIILQLILVFVLTIMMLVEPKRYRRLLLTLFPSFYRRRADKILTKSETALGNWLSGIALNCLFISITSGIGLAIIQVRLVLAHALLAGILNFIPNIGPALSVIFPLMIAVLEAPWKILAVIIWYFIIQNLETYWFSPTVMAKQVSLLPALTLTAQIFFAKTLGILGLLLALPLTVVVKTWIEEAFIKDILDQWRISTW
ncbi:MAG: AI-2E family transporter [Xenococcaceae cyanobacterium MO_188.B29]|nr:AI-2E family transporter [Xenococcaceae cyanobacterium MO_188.B29]